jgi:hypothetical protein
MFHRRFLLIAVAGLIVLGLLIGAQGAAQRDAWMQGYMMGRLSDGSAAGSAGALLPYAYQGGSFGPSHFGGGFGVLFGIGLLILGLAFAGRCMHARMWGMHGGPWQEHAEGHGEGGHDEHARYGHRPPFWWPDWDRPSESRPEKPERPESGGEGGKA